MLFLPSFLSISESCLAQITVITNLSKFDSMLKTSSWIQVFFFEPSWIQVHLLRLLCLLRWWIGEALYPRCAIGEAFGSRCYHHHQKSSNTWRKASAKTSVATLTNWDNDLKSFGNWSWQWAGSSISLVWLGLATKQTIHSGSGQIWLYLLAWYPFLSLIELVYF